MDTSFDAAEARHSLARLEERLQRDVGDIKRVLAADIPTHVLRAVRGTFERSARADGLDDAKVKALKAATQDASERISGEVLGALEAFEAWTWPAGEPLPKDPQDLRDHPGLAAALDRVEAGVRELLGAHGVGVEDLGDRGVYRMPAYFVAGHFMKSLVSSYWRALADFEALRARLVDADQSDQREQRRSRWDDA
ncbi:MAG: hypothetical protein AB7N76_11965 [Planctomycetota bacterium]